jgi:predicted TIM-barrel fold metal-dependent hydrolase
MENLQFFDCSCFIGKQAVLNPGSFWKTEDLVEKMGRYGIKKALVYHSLAREHCPEEGNMLLLQEIKKYPQLKPVWVVMHHHTGEFSRPEALLRKMKDHDVRIVRMFPSANDHRISLSEWNCGELLDMLEKHRIPLMLGLDQITWDELVLLLGNHPHLQLILTNLDYLVDRNLYSIMDKYQNIYMETMGYKVCNGIMEICRRFGAKRLIFGSCMPLYSGSSAAAMITYAPVNAEEKRRICCENLESLLGGVLYE